MCGWAGAGNIGDELLTSAIVGVLREEGAAPVVASRDPAETARLHGVEAVGWGVGAARAARTIDGVVVGPGGILQDGSSLWNLPGHLGAAIVARRRGRPVAAVGVGAEPVSRRSSERMLRRALGGRPVVTRDAESTAALAEAGVDAATGRDLVFDADLGRFDGAGAPEEGELVVAVGPSVRPGRFLPASRRLVPPPLAAIAAAIDDLAARLDRPIALTAFRGARDRATAEQLAAALRSTARVVPDSVDDHVAAVAGARLVVTSRYHAVVLAVRAGAPTAVVSAEPKLGSLGAELPGVHLLPGWTEVAALDPEHLAAPSAPPTDETARSVVHRLVVEAGARGAGGDGG